MKDKPKFACRWGKKSFQEVRTAVFTKAQEPEPPGHVQETRFPIPGVWRWDFTFPLYFSLHMMKDVYGERLYVA